LAGEIELAVLIDEAIQRGQRRRLADGGGQLLVGLELAACRAQTPREEGRPLRAGSGPPEKTGGPGRTA
jgi:hypothetical protein